MSLCCHHGPDRLSESKRVWCPTPRHRTPRALLCMAGQTGAQGELGLVVPQARHRESCPFVGRHVPRQTTSNQRARRDLAWQASCSATSADTLCCCVQWLLSHPQDEQGLPRAVNGSVRTRLQHRPALTSGLVRWAPPAGCGPRPSPTKCWRVVVGGS